MNERAAPCNKMSGAVRYNFNVQRNSHRRPKVQPEPPETRYEGNSLNNQVYFNKTYSAETNINFQKTISSMATLIISFITARPLHTTRLFHCSTSPSLRFLLKNKTGELKFSVNNLLDQSLSVTQSATANYLQQQQVTNNLAGTSW